MAEQQELNLETMPLEELKARALAEEQKEEAKEPEKTSAAEVADMELPADEAAEENEQFVYKKEIDLGDGSGVQVFSGTGATALEALEELTEKLADAQRHATKKIHELNTRVKTEDTRTAQQKTDDAYVLKQRLDKEPDKVIDERVDRRYAEIKATEQRELAVQQAFVDSHPDYVSTPRSKEAQENGTRMIQWMQLNGLTEMTENNLEKAYQSLKASGLLHIKAEEAGGVAEEETKETQRIVETKVEATQPRSPRKASTVSLRGGGAPVVKTGPTEDELYSMPLEKLKQLSNEQLAKAGTE